MIKTAFVKIWGETVGAVGQHALSINGKRKDVHQNDLLTVAKSMSIKKAERIITQINENVQK